VALCSTMPSSTLRVVELSITEHYLGDSQRPLTDRLRSRPVVPHLPRGNHHSVRSKRRRAAAATTVLGRSPTSLHTRSIASVTSVGPWRARYSTKAALTNLLRDRPVERTRRSNSLSSLSGIDIAILTKNCYAAPRFLPCRASAAAFGFLAATRSRGRRRPIWSRAALLLTQRLCLG
jgi:hypothetical protein